jgi:hypothetical protein
MTHPCEWKTDKWDMGATSGDHRHVDGGLNALDETGNRSGPKGRDPLGESGYLAMVSSSTGSVLKVVDWIMTKIIQETALLLKECEEV